MSRISIFLIFLIAFTSCEKKQVSLVSEDLTTKIIKPSDMPSLTFKEKYYVAAYSDLYYQEGNDKFQCTVILSLRNVSTTDTLYFTTADYYDSNGKLLRNYLKGETLELKPLESAEYIVEKRESLGGVGANFIVEYGTTSPPKNKALIEAINIGNFSQHGFSFKSRAILINE
ncbi:DUF3124 domain-containing protein [Flammeovirga aprica]|uniref:DUF3124 domain-containing protein n=1 Tax=Flammeovirga aprica JL-4 TaxID=694437 RepID=A0A7X9NZV4_9BACT|nr:DUF3124 domain-containing protein [Flammeovirga aprica]NME66986.1 DUF3124 domain-containing protein [Flammeovirga aprica JL-4]